MADGAEVATFEGHAGSGFPDKDGNGEKEGEGDDAEVMQKSGNVSGFAEVHDWQSRIYS
jgi:hypothetical protein